MDKGSYLVFAQEFAQGSKKLSVSRTDALREIKAKRLLVMIDCCHAEGMAAAKEGPAALKLPPGLVQTAPPKGLVEQLKQGEGRAVFTSSRGQQLSWMYPDGDVMKTWPCADFSVIRDLLRILSWCKPVFAGIEPILPTSLGTSPRRP